MEKSKDRDRDKQKAQQKKQVTRKKLICYFLAMSKGQQALQSLQQQLLMHPYFNPILLFKKISQGHTTMSQGQLIEYMMRRAGIVSRAEIEAYLKKNRLGKLIECQQFIGALLPYAPDTLRNSHSTVLWQLKSSPTLKPDFELLFKQILQCETSQITNISSFRHQLSQSWPELSSLIRRDLARNCPVIEKRLLEGETDMVKIRRWMELWIQVREKDVLDVVRWIGGASEADVRGYYERVFVEGTICRCGQGEQQIKLKQEPQRDKMAMLRSLSVRPLSRKEQEMLNRKISYIESQAQSRMSKQSPLLRSASQSNQFRKSSTAYSTQRQQNSPEKSLSLWCQYIHTILQGQKLLAHNRALLKPCIEKVHAILRDSVMSRKKQRTKISRIIGFVDGHCELSRGDCKLMEKYLGQLSIANQVIISVFNGGLAELGGLAHGNGTEEIKEQNEDGRREQKSVRQLKMQIAETLKQYCLTKSKLIQLSKQIILTNSHHQMYKLLTPTQEPSLSRDNLARMLAQMSIEHRQEDLEILMRHFGDGKEISEESFCRVFYIQGK